MINIQKGLVVELAQIRSALEENFSEFFFFTAKYMFTVVPTKENISIFVCCKNLKLRLKHPR